ncbi:2-phosphosulfolactate phosphatase [Actinoplanes sp. KI2]|uniref:2-phosphosulfolactate phosphatase n=1 Tax=Actinoplanes sp. KI2 TaxID=2983315 RepID=UPI0021D5C617|nr:2-phosphosulfolactate phosphatase [Actinoplanes sp. KI2]MCU7724832.1 2-phosphosulfolactate phosphatase [Actinoplanes sp. KI2]
MSLADGQGGYRVRFDWGPVGADAVAPGAAFVAVIDVLSFTTTLTVAIEQGLHVLPYRWRDDSAVDVARRHGAMLAVLRKEAGPGQVTLSPESILHANLRADGIDRLVLPSPNGSAISVRLADAGVTVVGVSLRNAAAAAAWVRERAGDRPVGVVASGERWPDGSLRPAIEDLLGAGAFLHGLAGGNDGLGGGNDKGFSPEAGAAMWAYRGVAEGLGDALRESVSGRELRGFGFEGDVSVASAVDVSSVVPVLRDGWYVDGGSFAAE